MIDSVLGHHPLPAALHPILGGLGRYALLAVVVAAGLVLTALAHGLGVVDNYVNTKLNLHLSLDFRSALYEHVQRLSLAFHDQVPIGQVMYRLNQQANSVGGIVVGLPPLVQSVVTVAGMFVIAALIDWQLALLAIAVLPLIVYAARYQVRRIEPRLYEVRNLEAKSQSTLYEAISMIRVTLAFGRESSEHRRWRDQAEVANAARVGVTVRQTLFSVAVATITAAGTALVLGFGALAVMHHKLTLGELVVLLGYLAAMYQPLEQASMALSTLQQQFVSFDTALELLSIAPAIADPADGARLHRARGEGEFDGVVFEYGRAREESLSNRADALDPDTAAAVGGMPLSTQARAFLRQPAIRELLSRARDMGLKLEGSVATRGRAALCDISFKAQAGQRVAIVGPTGAGKTTLVNLILRFYDPTAGVVRVDGTDIRCFTLTSLRDQMSVVLQEPMLFAGTIAENIRYSRPEARDDEVKAAAKAANVHDFVSSLPDGYDTLIGERGSQLSGGERQRISVARAFLKAAPILLLDEPTSSIDSRTEAVVLSALRRLMQGRTTFTVSHRMSTSRDADLILVLDDGQLVASGTHDSLIAAGGLYAQLYSAQLGEGSEEAFGTAVGQSAPLRVPGIFVLVGKLVVAAVAALMEDESADQLYELFRLIPPRLRRPAWWLLIGAVFSALHDGSMAELSRLSLRRTDPNPAVAGIAEVAGALATEREVLQAIHRRLGRIEAPAHIARAPEPAADDPWAGLEAAYPDASAVLAKILPRAHP